MIKNIVALMTCICAGLFCTNTYGKAPLNAESVIKQAAAEEAKVKTGSLFLLEVTTHTPQSEADIQRTGVAGSTLKGALQIERETPLQIVGKRNILFDDQRSALLIESSDDHQTLYHKVYLDKTVTKNFCKTKNVTDPSKPYVPTYSVSAPLPSLDEYHAIWVSRFWQDKNTEQAQIRRGDDGLLWIDLPKRFGHQLRVEVDPRQHYAIKTIVMVDLKLHRSRLEIRITRTLRDGIWYPSSVTQFRYDVNAPVNKKVIDETVTEVQTANLNIPVAAKDLDFGEVPADAHVTDSRFSPPLDYQQGTRQFSDAELKNMSLQPSVIPRVVAETNAEDAASKRAFGSVRSIVTAFVGISGGVFLILLGRHVLRRPA